MTVRVISVNVGLPRVASWQGRTVATGIFKQPVDDDVSLVGVNLEGDGQADRELHGGADKAVYAYPAEYYAYWRQALGRELPWGMFGENLTVEGIPTEHEIAIGDRFRIGTAELVVTQPRLPCFKLGLRFDDPQMVRRFLAKAGRTGYYLRIAIPVVSRPATRSSRWPVTRHASRSPTSPGFSRGEMGRRGAAPGAGSGGAARGLEGLLRTAETRMTDRASGFVNDTEGNENDVHHHPWTRRPARVHQRLKAPRAPAPQLHHCYLKQH